MTMQHQVHTGTASTFFDLLNLVEGRLKELLPQFQGALDQIKADFKVDHSDTYVRMHNSLGDLDDLMGHLEYLRSARNSANDVTISLPADLADRAETHAEDVQEALDNAASVFAGLEQAITGGYVNSGDYFVASVLRLSHRALIDISEKEAATMRHVSNHIRQVQGERIRSTNAEAA